MGLVDRSDVLARTDLAALAEELLGPGRGSGRSARWHCPDPAHPDEHPSMGLFTGTRSGPAVPRWKCHACGAGGTAVDLLILARGLDAGAALRELADRAGVETAPSTPASGISGRAPVADPLAAQPDPAVEELVAAAAGLLWQPVGAMARRYLAGRGLPPELLRVNRVGFDPGPALLPRVRGLPRRGPGVVFPVLDPLDPHRAVYYQVRALSPDVAADRKYDQPSAALAPNPRLAAVRLPDPPRTGVLAICEGFPDALTAAATGVPALALLGISHAGASAVDELARRIVTGHPAPAYAVCFDNQPALAVEAAHRLTAALGRLGVPAFSVSPAPGEKDLNAWWQSSPADVISRLPGFG